MVLKHTSLRMITMVVLWAILIFSETALPAPQKGSAKSRTCVTHVLFLGNSYTYFNNLPALVSELAKAGHQCKVETRMVAPGGKRLQDHWESSESHEALNSQAWDFVVLQDQSTASPKND